ncbi:hypothetical protein KC902_04315 [Candidatus Kaiserbacteria bacterium]|nr:hypothetical protein [Candidatus Kaiserbacteria bacterium]
MNPRLKKKSTSEDQYLEQIILSIESLPCDEYFSDHLGENQSAQKSIVARFQKDLCVKLMQDIPETQWRTEYTPNSTSRDSIDIFGENEDSVVAIELDKHRADQVAKKFVSRVSALPHGKVYFVSLCYPGTASMNKSECIKYFGYCADLANRMGNAYAGFTVDSET